MPVNDVDMPGPDVPEYHARDTKIVKAESMSRDELFHRARRTDLGILPRRKISELVEIAFQHDDPVAWMDYQSAAMESAIDNFHSIPDFPVSHNGEVATPAYRASCPKFGKKHPAVRVYAHAMRTRRCKCDHCGATWDDKWGGRERARAA